MPRRSNASHLPDAVPPWHAEKRRVILHFRLKAKNRCQLVHASRRGFDGVGERLVITFNKSELVRRVREGLQRFWMERIASSRQTCGGVQHQRAFSKTRKVTARAKRIRACFVLSSPLHSVLEIHNCSREWIAVVVTMLGVHCLVYFTLCDEKT
jgi:hypothetical protein